VAGFLAGEGEAVEAARGDPRARGRSLQVVILVGVVGTSSPAVCGMITQFPEQRERELIDQLQRDVRVLSEEIGDRHLGRYDQLQRAARYITEQLTQAGYAVESQAYTVQGRTVANLIAPKPGVSRPDEVILLGAHYDTCFNPGADDNASGIAGLLALARRLARRPLHRTIKWIAFVNEEPPYFQTAQMGSWVYARAAKARQERLQAILILEMIGYYTDQPHSQHYPPVLGWFRPQRGNFLGLVGNFRSARLVKTVDQLFARHSKCPMEAIATFESIPGVSWSDQWAFWREGYPAVMLTDTAFLRNPHYHQPSDTWETLDYARMAWVVDGLAAVLTALAGEAPAATQDVHPAAESP